MQRFRPILAVKAFFAYKGRINKHRPKILPAGTRKSRNDTILVYEKSNATHLLATYIVLLHGAGQTSHHQADAHPGGRLEQGGYPRLYGGLLEIRLADVHQQARAKLRLAANAGWL